jgi:RNA polymerase sigma factor (sigma-70 family)
MNANVLPPYSAEQLIAMAKCHVSKYALHEIDREDAEAAYVQGGIEALSRFNAEKTDGGARGFQVCYAIGYVKKYFAMRSTVCKNENVSLSAEIRGGDEEREPLGDTFVGKSIGETATVEEKEMRERVAMAVASLPAKQSFVMTRLYWDGKKAREIAAEIGTSDTYVSQLIAKAETTLRERLKEYAGTVAA